LLHCLHRFGVFGKIPVYVHLSLVGLRSVHSIFLMLFYCLKFMSRLILLTRKARHMLRSFDGYTRRSNRPTGSPRSYTNQVLQPDLIDQSPPKDTRSGTLYRLGLHRANGCSSTAIVNHCCFPSDAVDDSSCADSMRIPDMTVLWLRFAVDSQGDDCWLMTIEGSKGRPLCRFPFCAR
jgi:hypothetical protein